jgi:hypothetical protein
MESILIGLGVNALLQVVKSQKDRRKWAAALAKVFVAIRQASLEDDVLLAAITSKEASAK